MKNYKKIDHFEPIAMKCTQEKFEEIKPILEKFNKNNRFGTLIDFVQWNYLFNNWGDGNKEQTLITNNGISDVTNEIVYNEWNAKTFLKACGIVEKQPKLKISTELLKQLADNNSFSEQLIKKEFPQLFESEKLEVEVNKWYKANSGAIGFKSENGEYYGFNADGEFKNIRDFDHYYEFENAKWNWLPMTEKEVETALINEAKKIGYENKNIILITGNVGSISYLKLNNGNFKYLENSNELKYEMLNNSYTVFRNGTWAEIIETPTDIIEIVEKYGKDKVISLIEKI